MIVAAAAALLGADPAAPGWVRVEDGVVVETGAGAPSSRPDLSPDVLLPGFVDLHVHGGGGHDVARSPEDLAGAVAFHRRHGTSATLVSLVAAPVDALCRQLGWIADRAELGVRADGAVLGAHLEGPFLAHARCGAQNPAHLLAPDLGALRELVAAARGHLRCVTIAPELPGALELVDELVSHGVVVAVGHTDATYAEAVAAFEHGATLVTHLGNGMRPFHHREPGPALAALERGVPCELINDGAHLHPAVVRGVHSAGRPVLITDAMDAAGMGDGRYALGGQPVEVRDGLARLVANGSLAGSTLTMDAALRRAVRDGSPLERVSAAASRTPAAVLGLAERFGEVAVGRAANLVLLDADLRVTAVVAGPDVIGPATSQ